MIKIPQRKLEPTIDDLNQWQDIIKRVEEGGNDGADVYEADCFVEYFRSKYGRHPNSMTNRAVLKVPDRNASVYSPNCTRCGKGIFVATFPVSQEKMESILTQAGWKFPEGTCDACSCPLEVWERQRAEEIFEEYAPETCRLNHFKSQCRAAHPDKESEVDKWFERFH